jgi:GDP-4-dehydro-6-deoxy-D-mannose reductase
MNVLLAATQSSPTPRLVFVSTGYVYEASDAAVDESSPLGPDSLYAAAKLAAERALTTMSRVVGVDVVVARPFNHIGPGQRETFLVPQLARQVAGVATGATSAVQIRDPSIVRDFTDVRDVVRAYRLLAQRGEAGEAYNIASGRGRSVADVANLLADIAGTQVGLDAAGPTGRDEAAVLIGAAGRMEALGWERRYDLPTTLRDVLEPYLAMAAST